MLIINPGTEPVEGATLEHALANMEQLKRDAQLFDDVLQKHLSEKDAGGRYSFVLVLPAGAGFGGSRAVTIDMPGLPLEQVRYLAQPDQDVWDYPRLYIEGSSFLWIYVVGQLNIALMQEQECGCGTIRVEYRNVGTELAARLKNERRGLLQESDGWL